MNFIKSNRLRLAVSVILLAAGPVALADTVDVAIQGLAFVPESLTVSIGTTVRWTNLDGFPHTSTSDALIWDSGNLNTNDTYSYTFNVFGDFPYHCSIHPSMTAVVMVTKAVPTTGTYGLIVLILLLIGAAVFLMRRRKAAV